MQTFALHTVAKGCWIIGSILLSPGSVKISDERRICTNGQKYTAVPKQRAVLPSQSPRPSSSLVLAISCQSPYGVIETQLS